MCKTVFTKSTSLSKIACWFWNVEWDTLYIHGGELRLHYALTRLYCSPVLTSRLPIFTRIFHSRYSRIFKHIIGRFLTLLSCNNNFFCSKLSWFKIQYFPSWQLQTYVLHFPPRGARLIPSERRRKLLAQYRYCIRSQIWQYTSLQPKLGIFSP